MVIISVWVLVNINCHLSWKWMDKWLPALVINPLVWGLFFVNYIWQCLWHWFLWLVFFGEFIWSFSGVFLYRSVWYHRTEVRIYLWLVVPRRSDQTEQQTRRQCVTPTSLPFVVYGGSSVECLTRCAYWWKLSIWMIWQCVLKMLILSVRNTHQWLIFNEEVTKSILVLVYFTCMFSAV